MILAVEIGNTNIVLAIHNGEEWIHRFRYETKEDQPFVFFEVGLRDLLLEWNIDPDDINQVGMSSVVPEMNDRIIQALESNTRKTPVLLTPELFMKQDFRVPKPYEIGADLVANAKSALTKYDRDCIIVDFGTALTFTVVTKELGIEGVTIAPGILTAFKALSYNTAQLPVVSLSMPESAIGKDTDMAIRAGVLYGYIGLVKEIVSRIELEKDQKFTIIAAGGLSTVISPLTDFFDVIDKELTIDGIRFFLMDDL